VEKSLADRKPVCVLILAETFPAKARRVLHRVATALDALREIERHRYLDSLAEIHVH
jgi:hypothetical protein